ncbi:30S ribosomal protein S20 [Oenococcus oeni]|uniref:30S ribosomal protein S20 n=1 Tax=Oenococcus oeni TaxID=1247 RepID=UPI0008F815A4|nr:30S ribosomal protein S20 [Oenococcus oeni]OIK87504.1 30S ribosomal protein S20 [Oenococcus oeni]
MPIIESSIQRERLNKAERAVRAPQISAYRTAVKNFEKAAAGADNLQELFSKTSAAIDKAETKNLIKKNKAARDKARLYKLLKAATSK